MRLNKTSRENFQRLSNLFNGKLMAFASLLPNHSKFKAVGFMDLVIEMIGRSDQEYPVLSIAHYFEQNGDLVPDPEMTLWLLPNGHVYVVSYLDQWKFQSIFTTPGKIDSNLAEELNLFLHSWLVNIEKQSYKLTD